MEATGVESVRWRSGTAPQAEPLTTLRAVHGGIRDGRPGSLPWVCAGPVLAPVASAVVLVEPLLGGVGIGLVGVSLWVALCWRRPVTAFALVVAFIVFSSHVFAVAYNFGAPGGIVRYSILLKDVLAWLLVAVLVARLVRDKRPAWPVLALAVSLVVCGFLLVALPTPAPLEVRIQSMRSALIPVLALGSVVLLSSDERRRVSVAVVYMVAIGAAYALAELSFPRAYLTDVIGVGRYWAEVKSQPLFLDVTTGLPGNFFTTGGFPRLSGSFGDPLSAGENLGAALILAVAHRPALRWSGVVIAVLAVALLLSFTRNGWLLAALGLSAFALLRHGIPRTVAAAAAVTAVLVAATTWIPPLDAYIRGILAGEDSSTVAHQAALEDSLQMSFPLLGYGWGTGGAGVAQTYAAAVTSENTYIVVLTQAGWLGAALLAAPLAMLCILAVRGQPFAAAGVAVLLAQAVTGMVSENLLTFNAGFLPFATVGLVAVAARSEARRTGRVTRGPAPRVAARVEPFPGPTGGATPDIGHRVRGSAARSYFPAGT